MFPQHTSLQNTGPGLDSRRLHMLPIFLILEGSLSINNNCELFLKLGLVLITTAASAHILGMKTTCHIWTISVPQRLVLSPRPGPHVLRLPQRLHPTRTHGDPGELLLLQRPRLENVRLIGGKEEKRSATNRLWSGFLKHSSDGRGSTRSVLRSRRREWREGGGGISHPPNPHYIISACL